MSRRYRVDIDRHGVGGVQLSSGNITVMTGSGARGSSPGPQTARRVTSTPGYKPLDQLKALAGRAGIGHATWKMFRHSMTTHAKQWFGLSADQVKSQLRHTTTETQKHYDQRDRENLRAMVRGIDFRREDQPNAALAASVPPPPSG